MLPIPHVLLFVPIAVFAALALIALVMELAGRRKAAARPRPQAARPSAQILYFRPRQTPLPSALRAGAR